LCDFEEKSLKSPTFGQPSKESEFSENPNSLSQHLQQFNSSNTPCIIPGLHLQLLFLHLASFRGSLPSKAPAAGSK